MSESTGRPNVARAGGIMFASLLLSRILGLVREAVMAGKFGAGADADAYTLAFLIPDFLFYAIAGGALSSAFIPVFSEFIHTNREKEAWKLFSVVISVMSIVVLAFIACAWVLAPWALDTFTGASAEQIPLITHLSRIVLPTQFAFFIGGIMFGTLYARQRFVAPGLGPNIYNVSIIFGALVLSGFFVRGIEGMAWGALIGAFAGNLVVPYFVIRKLGAKFEFSLDLKNEGVRKVFKLMLPVVLGLSLPGVYGLIMRTLGSLYGTGIVASLEYANKLMQAPLGVFGQSLAIAVFPALSQFFAQNRMDMFRNQLASTVRTVLYITVPISALMFVLSSEIVTVIYRHGNLTGAEAQVIARLLQFFALGIFAWCLHPVLMRAFFSLHISRTPIVIGTVITGLFLGLSLALRATPLTYYALPIASSISSTILAGALLYSIGKKTEGLDYPGIIATFFKTAFAAVVAAAITYAVLAFLPEKISLGDKLYAIIKLLGIGLPAAWIYYFITRALKMPETSTIDRALSKLSRSPEAKVVSDETEIGG